MSARTITFTGHESVQLSGEAWGNESNPPVLLLHGGGQTRFAWGGTARELAAAGWYAVSLDLRGHGDSAWAPEGNYDIDAFAGDAAAVASTFSRPPAVVGASLGGIASLVAQADSGDSLFSAVILVDIAPRMEPEGVSRIISFMGNKLEEGFATLEEAAESIAAYMPHRPRPKDVTGLQKNLRLGEDGRYRWHWDPQFMIGKRPPAASREPERLVRAAQSLRVPTMLVRGRMSDICSEEAAQEFLALAPHARYVDVAGASHMVAGDRNDVFTRAVVEFLEELRTAA
jgi:pimeloyl-ACP methyl ester carboxylesterase